MWIAAIFAILAAVASAAGTAMQANAQKKAAQYNQDVEKKNADAAAQQAAFDAQRIKDKNRRLLAAQRAAFGSSGIEADDDVTTDAAIEGEMDRLVSIYTGSTAANAHRARAEMYGMEARNWKTAGAIGVGTSLLGGASSASFYATNPSFN